MCEMLEAIITASDRVENALLKQAIRERLILHKQRYRQLEHGYNTLTVSKQDHDVLRKFLHGWSVIFDSDLALAGINNRLTLMLHGKASEIPDIAASGIAESHILDAIIQLNAPAEERREEDNHHHYFRVMANAICAGESWALPDALSTEVYAFKEWRTKMCVTAEDIQQSFMAELIHLVHMTGVLSVLAPRLVDWLQKHYGWEEGHSAQQLVWIKHQLSENIPHQMANLQKAFASCLTAFDNAWDREMFEHVFDAYVMCQADIMNGLTRQMAISEAA